MFVHYRVWQNIQSESRVWTGICQIELKDTSAHERLENTSEWTGQKGNMEDTSRDVYGHKDLSYRRILMKANASARAPCERSAAERGFAPLPGEDWS